MSAFPPLPDTTGPGVPARAEFRRSIADLDDRLVGAAATLIETLPRATRALLLADHGAVAEIASRTHAVQASCRQIEQACFTLLAREAPVAGDLRRLVGILRLVTATERAAALTRHVGEAVDHIDTGRLPPSVRATIEELSRLALDVFRRGVDAWRQRDGLAVHEIDSLDEAVDNTRVRLIDDARSQVDGAAELLVLGLLGRYLERIADHGVSFAQHATFAVTGERIDVGRLEP
ncbi:MAG TPA: PhoU domain-containing protein [Egicoccus sp.]|nr:PhoU domain-containing protein [Egicoccus sp.]HSK22789.1 PhoU domain-containing protein [Egicoccus sp.]